MHNRILSLVLLAMFFSASAFAEKPMAESHSDGDIFADTWVATDALNRKAPGFAECGPLRTNKVVGIFYWSWHTPRKGPNDVTKILEEARRKAGNAPLTSIDWPTNSGDAFHWGEPELGYYRSTDPFVIRKHASMLADAGVDVILFDTTNPPHTWKNEYEAICAEFTELRRIGTRAPQIGFITPFGDPRPVLDQLWQDLYKPGRWKDTWFMWKGKPLILADEGYVKDPEMRGFFTFRRPMPDYWQGPSGPDQWSWLEVFPQHVFTNRAGQVEQMSVGVAQNALPNTPGPAPMSHKRGAMGRSWHGGKLDGRPDAVNHGLNFDEQWSRAASVDPEFIFVTGWNEWIAGRYNEWSIYKDSDCYFPGGLFVDEYTQEYSRDCEPMRGGHTDNYYYQLAGWIRRYKGARPIPSATGPGKIRVDGNFTDWQTIQPEFRDTIGDTLHRNHPGYGDLIYRNDTGRNDFVMMKAAYDTSSLYFYAQTLEPISPRTGRHWMLLLLDTDQNAATGWLGYDYVVNLELLSDTKTTVKEWKRGEWTTVGKANYRVTGNAVELKVSRKLVGQSGRTPAFDFHWADNIQSFSGVSELGVNGDSAPNRRWNYRYQTAE